MSTFKFRSKVQSGDEETSYRFREDGACEVMYRKGKTIYTKVIPRSVSKSTDQSWHVEMDGPIARSVFHEGKGRPIEQVFDLTEEGVKKERGGSIEALTLFVVFALVLLRFWAEIMEGIRVLLH